MNSMHGRHTGRAQRGVTMLGLVLWGIVVGFVGYVAVRTLPTINEYMTIQSAVEKIAASPPPTVADIRKAFDRQKDIEYSIQSISGKDLEITKRGDKTIVSLKYSREIELAGPAFLVYRFQYQTN